MKKGMIISGIVILVLAVIAGLLYLLAGNGPVTPQPLPSVTARIQTVTSTLTATATASLTPSPTATATVTQTLTPTATTTLATRVAAVTLVMPEVTLPPTLTPQSANLRRLDAAPYPVEPLANATLIPAPYTDFTEWVSFESDHPALQYISGRWTPIVSPQASAGQYHFTEDPQAQVRFTFQGEGVRIRYVSFTNGGVWNIRLDGMIVDVIDTYAPLGTFTGTRVYTVQPGEHTLELQNTATANPTSSGHMLALDAVQIYRPDALTQIIPGGVLPTSTPTATLIPAREVELIAAPPSPAPTATPIPLQTVRVAIVIGYDENANGVLDVSEGVREISVRLVEVGTNQVLAHNFTDERGFASLQAATHAAVQVVVPYFGEVWPVQFNAGGTPTLTLLLSPGNQPGLIP